MGTIRAARGISDENKGVGGSVSTVSYQQDGDLFERVDTSPLASI